MGMIEIYTRPDETSDPVRATLNDDNYGIKSVGHKGGPEDIFFEAVQGDIQIELERREKGQC